MSDRPRNPTIVLAVFVSLATVGCDVGVSEEAADDPASIQLPEATCRDANATLAGAQDKLMMDTDTPGEAILPKAAWLSLEGKARDQIFDVVAVKAACAAARLEAEQPVMIRDEFGSVQSQRLVTIYQRQCPF